MRKRYVCMRCEEVAEEDELPNYCEFCGWDDGSFNTHKEELPQEVT